MEIDITTAFSELNLGEHHWLGNPMVRGDTLCGSSKLVGDAALPQDPHLTIPVVCLWLKHWAERDPHRCWSTAHK